MIQPNASEPQEAPTIGTALARVFRQPPFVVVVAILVIAALGLNTAVSYLQLHFKKEAVPLVKPLGVIPDRFGTWVQVSQDKVLDKEFQDVLGTDQYIFRDYVNEAVVGVGVAERFKDKDEDERHRILNEIRGKYPVAVVSMSVTYYTGMVDTVAHVPDRCVTADGYEPKSYETPAWPIARDLPTPAKPKDSRKQPTDEVEVRYINFEDQTAPSTGTASVTRSICYFFHANGEFVSSPLAVRQKLADLWEKKGYYAKIECMTTVDQSPVSAKVLTDFLTGALPEIYKCMPDWEKAHGGAAVSAGTASAVPVQQVAVK
jgi:hypothetical protein